MLWRSAGSSSLVAPGNSLPKVFHPAVHNFWVRDEASVGAWATGGLEFSGAGGAAAAFRRGLVFSGSSPNGAGPWERSVLVEGVGSGLRVRLVLPEVDGTGGAGFGAGGGGGGAAGACTAAGPGGAGAAGSCPGIATSCVLHSGMPVGSPVSNTLLSHCEKEFQNFLSSDVSGSKSRS